MKTLVLNIEGMGEYEFVLPSGLTTDQVFYTDGVLANQGSSVTLTPTGSELGFRLPASSQGVIEVRQTSGISQVWTPRSYTAVSGWEYIRPGDSAFYSLGVLLACILFFLLIRGAFRSRG